MQERKRINYNPNLFAFQNLRERYPGILPGNVERFAPVYYPIAVIQLSFFEETYEDFQPLQQTVLELIGSGLRQPEVISETMGLQLRYLTKVIETLHHEDNLIDEGLNLTELGRKSLVEQKKIAQKKTAQDYQLDALNGTLIKFGENVLQSSLSDVRSMNHSYMMMESVEGVPIQDIAQQIKLHPDVFLQEQKSIQINTLDVTDIQFKEMKFALCYLLKLTNMDAPVIFAKRINFKEEDPKERFAWRPLSLPDRYTAAEALGRQDDVPECTDYAAKYVLEVYNNLIRQGEFKRGELLEGDPKDIIERQRRFENRVHNVVKRRLNLTEDGYTLEFDSLSSRYDLEIRTHSVSRRSNDLVNVLIDIGNYGESILTANNLFGYVIRVHSSDPAITELAHRIAALAEGMSQSELIKTIRERMIEIENQSEEIDVIGSLRRITAEIEESDKSDNGKN